MYKVSRKIGIDARFWSQTGVGRCIREIVKELATLDSQNTYVIYLLEEDFDKVSLPANFTKIKTTIRWHTFGEQLFLPVRYLRDKLDVLFVPNFNVPFLYPGKIITTVHDLTLLRTRTGRATRLPYPIYPLKFIAGCFEHLIAVKKSRVIFTVSNYVKNDIVKTFKINPAKIVLTPNAVDENFYRRSDDQVSTALQKYEIGKPYLFYVGNGCTHKNLWRLIEAFDILSRENKALTLVLGGKKDFNYTGLEERSRKLASFERIKFIGFVSDEDLPCLYSGAELFVNPSMYEGFGIQVLEAYACGCKVACSNSTSLPEVGGDLADYFNSLDVQNIVDVVKKSLKTNHPEFSGKALEYVRKYSWSRSAQAIHDVMTKI